VGIGDEIPANRCPARDMPIGFHEAVQLGHGPHVRQPEECGDVPERFVRRQGCGENARVCGDAKIRYQRRPRQTEDFRAGGSRLDKAAGAGVTVARTVGRVEEDIHVEGITHVRSASRAA
jgi:hypothetical protein